MVIAALQFANTQRRWRDYKLRSFMQSNARRSLVLATLRRADLRCRPIKSQPATTLSASRSTTNSATTRDTPRSVSMTDLRNVSAMPWLVD